jgi:hypothetical protein
MWTRGLAVVLATLASLAASASPATADSSCPGDAPANPPGSATVWSEPQCLSATEANGEVPQVAIADDGSALAVWRFLDSSGTTRVQAAYRKRGENFQPVANGGFISEAGRKVGTYIRLKMNKRGDAIVVWEAREDNGKVGIRSAYKPFDGDFGAEQVVINSPGDPSFAFSFVEPEVGIDGTGAATVIFHKPPTVGFNGSPGPDGGSTYSSESRAAGVASTWGDKQDDLIPHEATSETAPVVYTETHGSLAENEGGARMVAFASQEYDHSTVRRQVLATASRGGGQTNWSFGGTRDQGATDQEIKSTHVAYSTDGLNFAYAWAEGTDFHGHYRSDDSYINGAFNGPGSNGAALGVDRVSAPNALALWSDGQALRATFANDCCPGSFNVPDGSPVPGGSAGADRTRPSMASDDTRQQIAVFKQTDNSSGPSPGAETVQAALRPADESTSFDDPIRLSPETNVDLENEGEDSGTPFLPKKGTGPKIAVNSGGEAVAAWAVFDGENLVVQVSLLTPRSNPAIPPPPPPPPRPKAAQPSVIQLARPIARDQAVVLIANVPDGVNKLEWNFDSKDEPPIVGDLQGGELQRTVRLRLPSSAFTARLHTTGPDGTHDYARSFSSLKPSPSKETAEVQNGLKKSPTPPVFAVGAKDTLTGQSDQCSPASVWSGQQKISGCFKPIEKLVDIPGLERGAVHELASELGVDETKKALMEKATQLTDGYVAEGKALLNDEFPVIPSGASDVVSLPQAKSLIAGRAELPVGSASYDPKNGFNLKLDPNKVKIPLGKLPKPPNLPKLGGLEIVGDWDVDLDKQEAKIKASVVLPDVIKKAGVKLANEVRLTATPDRVIVDGVRIGPADVDIGGLKITGFKLEYQREGDQWEGQAKACVISGACLDMAPPHGHILVKNGGLAFAGASLVFPGPGIPLFTGVNLESIGFGIGTDPTRMIGSVGIGVIHLIAVEGRVVLAFPSERTPFILKRDEVGDGFPADLYGASFTRPTTGVTGRVLLHVPGVSDIEFGHAYLLYEFPGYIALGGGFDLDLLNIVQLRGGVSAEVDIPRELFNIHGNIQGCLFESDDLCGGAVANVSHGPNKAGGAGACLTVGPLSVGGGVQWAHLSDPFIWPFDGCKWSPFHLDVRPSRAARAAAAGYPVEVRAGAPSPAIKLFGRGGAPLVRVKGPGGQQLDGISPKKLDASPGGKIRILRFEGNKDAGPFTVVGLEKAQPGRYTIEALPSSPAITRIDRATDQPDAKISGRVTGRGRRRVLRYKVLDRVGQRVTFQEVEKGGAAKTIGSTTRGGRGRIRFSSAPGLGRRQIVAQFELSDIPAERKVLATFKPQSPHLAKPRRVRVRHRGSRLLVRWRRVRGAARYEVAAALSGRRMAFASTRRRRVTIKNVPRWRSGRVTVRAIDSVRQSRPAGSSRFKATGDRPSPFRDLLRCVYGESVIRCGARFGSGTACLPQTAGVSGVRIGPFRLGASFRELFRRYSAISRSGGATSFCVRGGGRFVVVPRKGKVAFMATTAPGHTTRRLGPGDRLRGPLLGARRVLGGLLVGHRKDPGRVIYGVRGRRVKFLAVALRRQALSPGSLAGRLRSLGLR